MNLHRIAGGGEDFALSNNVVWIDEFDWNKHTQATEYTLGGNLIINDGGEPLKGGRPITLQSGDGTGWNRGHIKKLYEWSQLPKEKFDLTLPDGRVFKVMFKKADKPVQGDALWRHNVMTDESEYTNVVLKFMETPE